MVAGPSSLSPLLLLSALTALASTPLLSGSAHAYTLYLTDGDPARCSAGETNYCPQPLRWWRRDTIFTLAQVSPGEFELGLVRGLVETSFDAWMDADCAASASPNGLIPTVTYGGTSNATTSTPPLTARSEPDNVIVFIRSSSEWTRRGNQPTWIAITKIAHDQTTGEIVDADIEINDGGYKFSIDDSPEAGEVDFLSMLVHELGHFYGLDHSLVATATMFATYSQSAANATDARTLDPDDVEGVCKLYTDVPERISNEKKSGCQSGGLGGGLGLLMFVLSALVIARRRLA